MHDNSALTYYQELDNLAKRNRAIYQFLVNNIGRVHTDRSVKDDMGFEDMNSVRRRISELIADNWVEEVSNMPCPKTGKSVRVLSAILPDERRARINNQGDLFA